MIPPLCTTSRHVTRSAVLCDHIVLAVRCRSRSPAAPRSSGRSRPLCSTWRNNFLPALRSGPEKGQRSRFYKGNNKMNLIITFWHKQNFLQAQICMQIFLAQILC